MSNCRMFSLRVVLRSRFGVSGQNIQYVQCKNHYVLIKHGCPHKTRKPLYECVYSLHSFQMSPQVQYISLFMYLLACFSALVLVNALKPS